MIDCPACGGPSRVLATRRDADSQRRRRECVKCGKRWTTVEVGLDYLRRIDRKAGGVVLRDTDRAELAALVPILQRIAQGRRS